MPPSISQDEWDARASTVGIEWLGPVDTAIAKVPARCLTCGYEWDAVPNRVQGGRGCPECGRKRSADAKRKPQEHWDRVAAQAGIVWQAPVAGALAPARARCLTCGHVWDVLPSNVQRGSGCPTCGHEAGGLRRRASRGQRDREALAVGIEWVEAPDLAAVPTLARCLACAHEWRVRPSSVQRGSGCPRCAGLLVTQETWNERAAAVDIEWLGPIDTAFTKVPARCLTCGHHWDAMPNKVEGGRGCPVCGREKGALARRVPQEEWDRRPDLKNIVWETPVVTKETNTPARCLVCDYRWNANPGHITGGRGCPRCAGKAPVSQEEWQRRAVLRRLVWEAPVVNNSTPTPARCLKCGWQWDAYPGTVQQGSGCPRCAGNLPLPQEEWDRRAARLNIVWTGKVISGGTKTPARCLTCEYEWEVLPDNVRKGQGCPRCAPSGFDPDAPSLLYLLLLPDPPLLKVGVAGVETTRLETHRRRGWDLVDSWPTPDGHTALDLENAVIEWWRLCGAVACQRHEVPAGDGFTECVYVGRVDVAGTHAYIESLAAWELRRYRATDGPQDV